jgi:hypothetical protein
MEQRLDRIRNAVALHARTLDDIALGKEDARDRDDIDNALYNQVRALDPKWWDDAVPGLARTSAEARDGRQEPAKRDQGEAVGSAEHGAPSPDAASRTPTPWELWRDIDPDLFGGR